MRKLRQNIKPCPCCGESRPAFEHKDKIKGLHAGTESSSSECVRCYTCGLRMVVNHFAYLKKGETWDQFERRTLAVAIRKWNKRDKV